MSTSSSGLVEAMVEAEICQLVSIFSKLSSEERVWFFDRFEIRVKRRRGRPSKKSEQNKSKRKRGRPLQRDEAFFQDVIWVVENHKKLLRGQGKASKDKDAIDAMLKSAGVSSSSERRKMLKTGQNVLALAKRSIPKIPT